MSGNLFCSYFRNSGREIITGGDWSIAPFKMTDSTCPRPQKSMGIVRSTALWSTCGQCSCGETPVLGVPAVCWPCCSGKAAGTSPGMWRPLVLVDTWTSQFFCRGYKQAALTHGFPRSRPQLIYLPVHSPDKWIC